MYEEQNQRKPQKYGRKIQIVSLVLTVIVVTVAVAVAAILEFGGWEYLHWAVRHPALISKYDPHHWVGRIAALVILYSIVHAFASVLRQPLATFRAWQRVFLPSPWDRREAEGREADRPAV